MIKSTNQDKNGTTRKLKAGFVCENGNAPLYMLKEATLTSTVVQ